MKETPRQKEKLDRLANLLRGTDPERLRSFLAKDATIIFRLSETDKADMQKTAAELGLTLTDYLVRLHLFAAELLAKDSKKGGR